MNCTERAVTFDCAQETLVGILTAPQTASPSLGVVVVVGGPQYRAGSHRQFVLLSRALAAGGYPVLRFDYRGMGDSTGAQRDFTLVSADIAAAITTLQLRLPSVQRVALWGLCDGASAALLYCHDTNDARVSGLCLLNPWVRSDVSLARAHVKHYYVQRLREPAFWSKLVKGGIAVRALADLAGALRLARRTGRTAEAGSFQARMLRAWRHFNGPVLLVLSGDDYTAKEFVEYVGVHDEWRAVVESGNVLRSELRRTDHTFSSAASRSAVEALTLEWLNAHQKP